MSTAERFSASCERRPPADAAGAANRFSFKLEIVNYPQHASSATALEQAVLSMMPTDNSIQGMAHLPVQSAEFSALLSRSKSP